jgi:hypothetical protein
MDKNYNKQFNSRLECIFGRGRLLTFSQSVSCFFWFFWGEFWALDFLFLFLFLLSTNYRKKWPTESDGQFGYAPLGHLHIRILFFVERIYMVT